MESIFTRIKLLEQQYLDADTRTDDGIRAIGVKLGLLREALEKQKSRNIRFTNIALAVVGLLGMYILSGNSADQLVWGVSIVGMFFLYFGVSWLLREAGRLPLTRLQRISRGDLSGEPDLLAMEKAIRLDDAEANRLANEIAPLRQQVKDKTIEYIKSLHIADEDVRIYLYNQFGLDLEPKNPTS